MFLSLHPAYDKIVRFRKYYNGTMREYFVTYKDQNGSLEERRIAARNHEASTKPLVDVGCEIVEVCRADGEEADTGRRVGSPAKSVAIAVLLALAVAVAGVAFFWWRRGCPAFW